MLCWATWRTFSSLWGASCRCDWLCGGDHKEVATRSCAPPASPAAEATCSVHACRKPPTQLCLWLVVPVGRQPHAPAAQQQAFGQPSRAAQRPPQPQRCRFQRWQALDGTSPHHAQPWRLNRPHQLLTFGQCCAQALAMLQWAQRPAPKPLLAAPEQCTFATSVAATPSGCWHMCFLTYSSAQTLPTCGLSTSALVSTWSGVCDSG